ncbi:carbohydrate ABC transporter permease [Brachybacterium sacelli]|uniref:Raffinose/stachyose/melibiose transport system permease protein n=1 Tax=Brachybacterium sacelli TaxID=173364 RepID=A0ABS4WZC0_9MICO|nr:sugar ABC transporter permease [Brachybacterium sacelli]MBP2381323.1 raffinose/stachyose/melibiose transport system permease protein [Brachybacterium sacelli]
MSQTTSTAPRRGAAEPTSPAPKRASTPARRRTDPIYYFFLFPALALFTLAVTLPAIVGFGYSFTNSIGFGDWEFIGLRNYIAVFRDQGILGAYGFTLGFSLVTVIIVNLIAFALALGLTSRIRFQAALRTIFVLPMVISGIIIAFVFKFLFANTLPAVAQALGIDALSSSILANESLAWVGIVIVTAWSTIPSTMLIYIAGLVTVPSDLYEAAAIDGASPVKKLWHVTLPLVSGYVVINTILGFKNYLNAYDIVVGLTDGGPGTATRTVAMSIFKGFEGGDYGYQMANAAVFFVISIVIAVVQLRLTRGKATFGA